MDMILEIIKDIRKGIVGYIKAQFILILITFLILSISLKVIEVPMAILISLAIAILDSLPIVGSGIVMIPWSIINFIIGNNQMGKSLAIVYIILVIVRQILEPKILGREIGVKPIYTFVSTVIGSLVLGPIGVIVGPLIAVIVNSILKIKKEP